MNSHLHEEQTYPPLNTLKPVAENIWIVDGPLIDFGPMFLKMQFPTRMVVARLKDGLFIHSPTPLTDELKTQVETLGPIRWIVGPNRIHYWWLPDWYNAFPEAEIWLAPRIREHAGGHINFSTKEISEEIGYPWDAEIHTLPVSGSYMTEVEFFHIASRTLILTDFIENFELAKVQGGWLKKILMQWGGVAAPDGSMPRDMRLTFKKQQPQLKSAIEKMIGWAPERIIIAHGRWFEKNGTAELKRAFNWLL